MSEPAEQPVPFDDSVALAERLGATRMDLMVRSVRRLTPLLVRVELTGDALHTFEYEPGQDLMLTADAGPPMVRRRWTIRSIDRATGSVALDVVVHPDVSGASGLHEAATGDVVEAIGPRGKVHLVPSSRVHHFLGDQSFLPAAFAMAEAVAAPARAVVTMTVPSAEERLPLDAPASDAVRWVAEQGDDAATGLALLEASGLGDPEDGVVVYVGGEMTLASTIRSALVRDRGWPRDAVMPKPYWRRGTANARNGEPGRE
ncbi:MAG TPA: siderophore-interacting protein [Actinomycetes bacterium]|jgi:NADPH-dependent ferric siderophore reductase|nr:siderophore-interacting protein [Actinomycetes bacterium]